MPSMRTAAANAARVIGISLSLAALAVLAWRSASLAGQLEHDFLTPGFIAAIMAAAFIYAWLGLLIGLAWYSLLASTSSADLPLGEALTIFARSQLLKYLPSNLLHYVGRHAAAYRSGAPHGALVWSSIAEAVLVTATAVVVAALFAQSLITKSLAQLDSPYWLALLLPAVAAVCFVGATAYLVLRGAKAKAASAAALAKGCLSACSLYVLFFLANGALLAGLVAILPENVSPAPLVLAGVVSLAWFAGFIVPGAPAGVGIRELILTMGLGEVGLGSSALSIVIGYRVVTLLGDLLLALAGFAFAKRCRRRQTGLIVHPPAARPRSAL
jgi:hypothetical protein